MRNKKLTRFRFLGLLVLLCRTMTELWRYFPCNALITPRVCLALLSSAPAHAQRARINQAFLSLSDSVVNSTWTQLLLLACDVGALVVVESRLDNDEVKRPRSSYSVTPNVCVLEGTR